MATSWKQRAPSSSPSSSSGRSCAPCWSHLSELTLCVLVLVLVWVEGQRQAAVGLLHLRCWGVLGRGDRRVDRWTDTVISSSVSGFLFFLPRGSRLELTLLTSSWLAVTMEPLALRTHLGDRQELVEGLRDLLHQVQQLQIRVPGRQRRDEPGVKREREPEQQGSARPDREPHHRRRLQLLPGRKNRNPSSHLSEHGGKGGLHIRVTLSK